MWIILNFQTVHSKTIFSFYVSFKVKIYSTSSHRQYLWWGVNDNWDSVTLLQRFLSAFSLQSGTLSTNSVFLTWLSKRKIQINIYCLSWCALLEHSVIVDVLTWLWIWFSESRVRVVHTDAWSSITKRGYRIVHSTHMVLNGPILCFHFVIEVW